MNHPLNHSTNQPSASGEPVRRAQARRRQSTRSRRLVLGLALVSVLSATAITATVEPSAPDPAGRPHLPSAR
ncbi:hypothetical protein ACGFY6_22650 [Streptomyces sp. NPDC048387]|uniref:hypothetical protein n=1 Tax=unclassified Streptomyces TaxID=2593676 RepID=UPI0033C80EE8